MRYWIAHAVVSKGVTQASACSIYKARGEEDACSLFTKEMEGMGYRVFNPVAFELPFQDRIKWDEEGD